jgi:Family of unknown function (DUF6152)
MRRNILLIIAATLLISTAAYAHHSYAATYDTTKEVKIEGTLVQFELRNPHAFVTIKAKDKEGAMQRWSVEWAGVSQLDNAGIKKESLKVGDDIVIVGNPSRVPGEFRLLMVNLKRPLDGFSWGSKPGEKVD